MNNLHTEVEALVGEQIRNWELARRNYAALKNIRSKTLRFDRFHLDVQFNPDRIRSTAAPVDRPAENHRPCPLCAANRSPQQNWIRWNDYDITVNPYPIFPRHLTVPHRDHIPQRLGGRLGDMVRLAEELPGYIVTFNGAESGASLPDHLHFQAVEKGALPVEREIPAWTRQTVLYRSGEVLVRSIDAYLRPLIAVEGVAEAAIRMAESLFTALGRMADNGKEAEVNVLAWTEEDGCRILFFPRTALRPWQHYAEGDERILFSPGAVDLGGVLITVRETDFSRMEVPLVTDLFRQIVPDEALWARIKKNMADLIIK